MDKTGPRNGTERLVVNLFLEIKISDGLGNQLFQYAAGRSLCIKNKIPYFLLNTENFRNNYLGRKFGLHHFGISGKIITSPTLEKFLRKETKYNRFLTRLPFYKTITEDVAALQDLSVRTGVFTSLQGYWQSEYYFKEIRPTLLAELVPLQLPAFPGWVEEKDTVAVHVRRTDYLTETGIGPLGEKYYEGSMDLIRSRLNNPLFVFFSDDISWCKEKFRGERILFCEQEEWSKDYLQLYLMSKCKHQITANSSFSWWGAWLNQNPDKIVIRAQNPFVNMSLVYRSYYPEEWIPVNN